MRIRYRTAGALAASCIIAAFSAHAQVWLIDFDSSTDMGMQTYRVSYTPPDPPANVSYGTIDTGDPAHQNALRFTVDSSASAHGWYADWGPSLVPKPVASYDPEHTFVQFELLVYELRPLHVQLSYGGGEPFTARGLQVDVNPTVSGSFQRFTLPLTAFQLVSLIGTPPNYPASFQFGIRGDPANPDTTWPSCATNMFMLDNIRYLISPPLSIAGSNNTVAIAWPTNAVGFTLQQSSSYTGLWTAVTNIPVVVNDQNQVLLQFVAGQNFYRLVGP